VDVTYLRQDFSMMLFGERYDFLVRSRSLTAEEAEVYREALRKATPGPQSPQRHAALAALRKLTGRDAGLTSEAWRKTLDLPPKDRSANAP
jgi:hypothetical protein